jgi:hypothetical protein
MSSIFGAAYLDTLKRIYNGPSQNKAKHDSASVEPTPGAKDFSSVLADLEKKPEKPGDKAVEQSRAPVVPSPVNGTISNLKPEELQSKVMLHESPPAAKPPILETAPTPQRVNTAYNDVKKLAAVKTEQIEKPQPPVIKSISRTRALRQYSRNFNREDLSDIISTAGRYHGVDPGLSLAVADAESSFRADAVSQDGHASKGIFQLLDSTAQDMIDKFKVGETYDPFDPAMNAYLGVGYLRRLHDIFSEETPLNGKLKTIPVKSAVDLEKVAVAAFNAGEGNVADAQHRAAAAGKDPTKYSSLEPYLPASTRVYVARVSGLRTKATGDDGSTDIA